MILRAMGLIKALKQANADKDKVIQHLLGLDIMDAMNNAHKKVAELDAPKHLDVFEITDKLMSMPRWEDVNRKLIAQIVGDVVKVIENK